MADWLKLIWASARNRASTLILCWIALGVASTLLIAVERLRDEARQSYARSAAGIDLVIGANGSALELFMAAVFHHGNVRQEIDLKILNEVQSHPAVAWVVPITLGDSHRGHPVIGTSSAYLAHLRNAEGSPLRLASGAPGEGLFDAVLGAEAAHSLGYKVGDEIILAHGESYEASGDDNEHAHDHAHSPGQSAHVHEDFTFKISGILEASGTAADRSIIVQQSGLEALHLNWGAGAPIPGLKIAQDQLRHFKLTPRKAGALLIGLRDRSAVFAVKEKLEALPSLPVQALLPSQALDQLWQILAQGEKVLALVSRLILAVAVIGLMATLLASMQLRRRELALLRAMGMRPWQLLLLPVTEGILLSGTAAVFGLGLALLSLSWAKPWLQREFALTPQVLSLQMSDLYLIMAIISAAALACLVPGLSASRRSLSDGLAPKY